MGGERPYFVVPNSSLTAIRIGAQQLPTEEAQQDAGGVLPAKRFATAGWGRGKGKAKGARRRGKWEGQRGRCMYVYHGGPALFTINILPPYVAVEWQVLT